MAYDQDLAWRIRQALGARSGLSERKMFGGLAFLINGNMAVAASRDGGILVRVDPQQSDALVRTTTAEPAVMGGRTMRGWLRVDAAHLTADAGLHAWIERGSSYAETLKEKR